MRYRRLWPRRAAVGLALAGCAAMGIIAAGCRLVGNHARDPSPAGCAECHAEIARQWAASTHASAWLDPVYVKATAQRRSTDCLPCHAPEPLLEQEPDEKPVLRDELRQSGVDCGVCHRRCGAYAGPYRTWGPHPTVQDRSRLSSSEFCGTCHEVEIREHREMYVPSLAASAPVRGCADCHMPLSTSRLTQGHALSYAHPRRATHDHSFPIWTEQLLHDAVAADGFRLEKPDADRAIVRFQLTNRGAGHCIPSGHYGHRVVVVKAELLDAAGAVLAAESWEIYAREYDVLKPGIPAPFDAQFTAAVAAQAAAVNVTVERISDDRNLRQPLLEHRWPISR